MCGVIGYASPAVTEESLDRLHTILLESSIRGRHASGLAWHDGESVQQLVLSEPMESLLADLDLTRVIRPDGSARVIGHARYSTSGLRYNQPLLLSGWALAHNGVVTQAEPQTWPVRCATDNDSELLLRAVVDGRDPVEAYPTASIAAVWLTPSGSLRWVRNGLRPLWRATDAADQYLASTADILLRAGLTDLTPVAPSGARADAQV